MGYSITGIGDSPYEHSSHQTRGSYLNRLHQASEKLTSSAVSKYAARWFKAHTKAGTDLLFLITTITFALTFMILVYGSEGARGESPKFPIALASSDLAAIAPAPISTADINTNTLTMQWEAQIGDLNLLYREPKKPELPKPIIPTATAAAVIVETERTYNWLTPDELDAAAIEAGWPMSHHAYWPIMRRIIMECENGSLNPNAHNTSDPAGGSIGLAQLNAGWFSYLGEDPAQRFDPVVNLRTALKLRERIGGFGTGAGWSCFYKLGIDLQYER